MQFGDSMTNIVVVQFSDYVQTGRDKRYNLTCLFRGPGEAVVTSGYIGAGCVCACARVPGARTPERLTEPD